MELAPANFTRDRPREPGTRSPSDNLNKTVGNMVPINTTQSRANYTPVLGWTSIIGNATDYLGRDTYLTTVKFGNPWGQQSHSDGLDWLKIKNPSDEQRVNQCEATCTEQRRDAREAGEPHDGRLCRFFEMTFTDFPAEGVTSHDCHLYTESWGANRTMRYFDYGGGGIPEERTQQGSWTSSYRFVKRVVPFSYGVMGAR